jgi:hypothetical protein
MSGETKDPRDAQPDVPKDDVPKDDVPKDDVPKDGVIPNGVIPDGVASASDSSDLTELAARLNPSVVAAPPVQSPPVQELAEIQHELAPIPMNIVRPLCWLLAAAGLSLSGPAIWLVVTNIYHNTAGSALPVWACGLFLLTMIYVGDATLLRIIPNRLVIRCACYTTAGGIAVTAGLLGALLVSSQGSGLFAALQLNSAAGSTLRITGGASVAWTFVMFNVLTLTTYVLGRVAYHQR